MIKGKAKLIDIESERQWQKLKKKLAKDKVSLKSFFRTAITNYLKEEK